MFKWKRFALMMVAGLMVVATQAVAQTPAELLAVRDAADKALNAHDVDTQVSYWTDDCVYDFVPLPTPFRGKAVARTFFEGLLAGIPDFTATASHVWAAGNIVVVECVARGTQTGEWMGIPPTGKSIQMPHIDLYEFEGTKIKRGATYGDMASLMMQLGVMPPSQLPELVPSFIVPDPEPTGLSPVAAAVEAINRWNSHDLTRYAKMIRSDATFFIAPFGAPMDRNGWLAASELYFKAMSDVHVYITRTTDLGNGWVLVEDVAHGTHDGPFFGVPPTGVPTSVRQVLLFHMDTDGRLQSMNAYFDNLTVLNQMMPTAPQPVNPGKQGLLAHYDFEADAKDISGNGYDGTLAGDAHVADGVLVLDGTDDAMAVPRIGGAGAVFSQLSYSMWVHPTVDQTPLAFSGGMNTNVWGAGAVHFKLRNGMINVGINGLAGGDLQGKTIVAPKVWSHLAVTVSDTEVSLYLNGQREDTRTLVAPLTNLILGDAALGAWNQNGTNIQREMTGFMDDVRIYSRGLSVGEVLWLASYRQNDQEANKIVARRFFEEMWNERRLDYVDELITPDMAGHAPTGEFTGYKGEMATISGNLAPFPDLQITVDEVIAEGNKVALRTSYRGTHLGTLMGQIPATGKPIRMTGNIIFRFENGKVAEAWSFADMLGLMQQIGAASPARPTPEDYAWSVPSTATGAPGDPEANKAMVRRFVDEAWNQQKLSVMDELFAPDVVSHNPPIEYLYGRSNLTILRQGVTDYLVAYPDLKVTLDDTVAEGAMVSARWTLKATHLGPLMGIAATGKPVTFTGVTMYRFAGGKIVELWWAWDTMGMMRQISPPKP